MNKTLGCVVLPKIPMMELAAFRRPKLDLGREGKGQWGTIRRRNGRGTGQHKKEE